MPAYVNLLPGKNAALQKSSGHLLSSRPAPAHDLCRIGLAHMTKLLPHLLRFDAVERAIDFGHILAHPGIGALT
jgi:hypothetical protein